MKIPEQCFVPLCLRVFVLGSLNTARLHCDNERQ